MNGWRDAGRRAIGIEGEKDEGKEGRKIGEKGGK